MRNLGKKIRVGFYIFLFIVTLIGSSLVDGIGMGIYSAFFNLSAWILIIESILWIFTKIKYFVKHKKVKKDLDISDNPSFNDDDSIEGEFLKKLNSLKDLMEEGVISEKEFIEKKDALLDLFDQKNKK